ncbi:MAG: hypothetical protein H7222_16660 [Methylotenera sp.]|nr:hypothetical protein [Oligoflexia bacterium]
MHLNCRNIILITVVSVLMISTPSARATDPVSLQNGFNSLLYNDLDARAAKTLAKASTQFVAAPENSEFLRSVSGKAILKQHAKLLNYLTVKDALAKCATESNTLKLRILNAAGATSTAEVSCKNLQTSSRTLEGFAQQIHEITDAAFKSDFELDLTQEMRKNALEEAMKAKLRFTRIMPDSNLVQKLCSPSGERASCTAADKKELHAHFKQTLREQESLLRAQTFSSQRNTQLPTPEELETARSDLFLSQAIGRPVGKIDAKKNALLPHTGKMDSGEATEQINALITRINKDPKSVSLNELSAGPGYLLFTKHLRKKAGKIVLGPDEVFRPLDHVQVNDVLKAVDSIEDEAGDLYQDLAEGLDHEPSVADTEKNLRRLIRINPVAVGQLLMKNPEYAGVTCKAMLDAEKYDRNLKIYSLVIGGTGAVLIATGVLSWAGAGLLGVAGSVGAAATVSSIGAVASAVAIPLLITQGLVGIQSARDSRQDMIEMERAYLLRTSDPAALKESRLALEDYHDAVMDAVLNLSCSAADFIPLISMSKASNLPEITAAIRALLKDNTVVQLIRSAGSYLAKTDIIHLISRLAEMNPEERLLTLKRLKTLKLWKMQNFIRHLVPKTVKFFSNYSKEVKETKGLRILVKARDQNQNRNIFKNSMGWINNPLAMARNSSWQVTTPISIAGYTYLFQKPVEAATESLEAKNRKRDAKVVKEDEANLPGSYAVTDLVNSGLIKPSDGDQILLRHNSDLYRWVMKEKGAELPRITQFRKLAWITEEEGQRLDEIARLTYAKMLQKRTTDIKTGNKDAKLDFTRELEGMTGQAIDRNPHFMKLPFHVKASFVRMFSPTLSLGNTTTTELEAKIMEGGENAYDLVLEDGKVRARNSKNLQLDPTGYALGRIYAFISEGMSPEEGYLMAYQAINNPEVLTKKAQEAYKVLPEAQIGVAMRPDRPGKSEPLVLATFKGSPRIETHSELDRWKTLFVDPRFSEVAEPFKMGHLSELQALDAFEATVIGLKEIYQVAEKRKAGVSPQSTVDSLLGIRTGTAGNPLFAGVVEQINRIEAPRHLNARQLEDCYQKVTDLTIDYQVRLAEITGMKNELAIRDERLKNAQLELQSAQPALLSTCGGK